MIVDAPQPRATRVTRKLTAIADLRRRNRFGSGPVVGDAPLVVSLTSYGPRIADCDLAIESIARSPQLPRRFILWISDADFSIADHPRLARLERRGLEIQRCPDYGPYKKSYPYAAEAADDGLPLLTADDDVIYPAAWLSTLLRAHRQQPEHLTGLRGHAVTFAGTGFASYLDWPPASTATASFRVLLTGVGGIVYPGALLGALRDRGEAFLRDCPMADDLWVHHTALRTGIRSRRVASGLTALGNR